MEEAGVARPMWNSAAHGCRLISQETVRRTPTAPKTPWTITKAVHPQPLKKPMKQNRNAVSRQRNYMLISTNIEDGLSPMNS